MLVANLGAAVAHPYAHLLISGINVPGVVTSTFLLSSFQKFFDGWLPFSPNQRLNSRMMVVPGITDC